ncbi:PREDICTED: neugrin [Nicrophorus vespilloides]|uniref:Neugrin n=1 Tax=Nicrophorus vespilloides TaxID=110193 RepID=A0ABM1NJF7_NICVS|nr:PREDICTED: neugrin [Nicrophorus vespilloides]
MLKFCVSSILKTQNVQKSVIRNARFKNKRREDAGIKYQTRLLGETQELDELEADFNAMNMSHRQHENEIRAMKEQVKYLIVKRKYFDKEKTPNFLTWADKMQIKHLHSKDPEEWNVERLSEGFPALPETILKILKGNWSKKNENKIKNHDLGVKRNWREFTAKKLDLPKDLVEHLRRFTNRSASTNEFVEEVEPKRQLLRIGGEFSEIIGSYERLKTKELLPEVKEVEVKRPLKETYLSENQEEFEVKQEMTFSAYKDSLRSKGEAANDVDKEIMKSEESKVVAETKEIELQVAKYVNRKGSISVLEKNDNKHLVYPERIIIPEKQRKRGSTYKLYDCYYDDDGTFLYRVPGME